MEARVRGRSWQGSAADRAGRTVGDREGTLDPRSERRRSPVPHQLWQQMPPSVNTPVKLAQALSLSQRVAANDENSDSPSRREGISSQMMMYSALKSTTILSCCMGTCPSICCIRKLGS
ncbi:hypothetical protein FNF29_04021 [Cafeteria roenbergensis]|uniref:Uncharacterized protein n=1 Tax=Cafeteria roenbergensis TaxID=33653 RepID=A0A5A8CGH0_CAFRO|nr:hypothetical protein FNF29_04021 [Cafeteria roenbergensis]|eukprot:KAA0152153.1 hypothetical protein FNF29_04021 [Cafeteria roenbergensis]